MTRPASLAWVLAAAATLFVLRFGYEYGAGDQEEMFSLLLHQLDPTLFSRDWFVVDQGSQFTVRTPFLWLMQAVVWVLPLWAATLLVFVTGWLGVAWGLYRLAEALGANALTASTATILILVAIPTWTLGGNSLAPNLLAPEMLGWALALPAVRYSIEKRLVRAGVLCPGDRRPRAGDSLWGAWRHASRALAPRSPARRYGSGHRATDDRRHCALPEHGRPSTR